jgi:recombination protein U
MANDVNVWKKKDWEDFEKLIEYANEQYRLKKQALIQKIATPWKVIRAYDNTLKKSVIYRAFPMEKSTVDFGGISLGGFSIWFDAKKSDHPNYLPIQNIKPHQIQFLTEVDSLGGKAFFLVYSKVHSRIYLLWIQDFLRFTQESTRKSIPWVWFEENCKQVYASVNNVLDYLKEVL